MTHKFIAIIIIATLTLSSCAAIGMNNLPEGDLMHSTPSPNETYIINSYLVSGNATVDFCVRCEVVVISSGEKRNIYWAYRCEKADVMWVDDNIVIINGIKLNVLTDTYDWRK